MTDTPIITRVFPNFDSDVKDTETLSAEAAVPETKCERPVPKPRTIFTFPQSSVAQQENSSESDESLVEWKGRFCTRWVTRACYNRLLTPRPVPPRITPPDEATVLAMLRNYNRNNNSRDRARRQPRRQPPQFQSALRYHTPFQPSTSLIPTFRPSGFNPTPRQPPHEYPKFQPSILPQSQPTSYQKNQQSAFDPLHLQPTTDILLPNQPRHGPSEFRPSTPPIIQQPASDRPNLQLLVSNPQHSEPTTIIRSSDQPRIQPKQSRPSAPPRLQQSSRQLQQVEPITFDHPHHRLKTYDAPRCFKPIPPPRRQQSSGHPVPVYPPVSQQLQPSARLIAYPQLSAPKDEYMSTFYRSTGKPGISDLRRMGVPILLKQESETHDKKYSSQEDWGGLELA